MNQWILEMREYNYDIQYVKDKDNFGADHLSRPVHIIVHAPEATWQKEEVVWEELAEYIPEGRKITYKTVA